MALRRADKDMKWYGTPPVATFEASDWGWIPAPYQVRGRLCAGTTVWGHVAPYIAMTMPAKLAQVPSILAEQPRGRYGYRYEHKDTHEPPRDRGRYATGAATALSIPSATAVCHDQRSL